MFERVKVICTNCGEHCLDTDLNKLKSPLKGDMFMQRLDTEWPMFEPDAEYMDLVCPQCGWTFHDEGMMKLDLVGGPKELFGYPEDLTKGFGLVRELGPRIRKCSVCEKPLESTNLTRFCNDECTKKAFESRVKQGGKGRKRKIEEKVGA